MDSASSQQRAGADILLVDCPDQRGLVHSITGVLTSHNANILTNDEFVDQDTQRFYMRSVFAGADRVDGLAEEVRRLLPEPATVRIPARGPHRIVVLVSTEHHCLGDLLMRHAEGELNASILAVVSNHERVERLVQRFGLPFHCVPHGGVARADHEAALTEVIERYRPDYLVLAKYMRILSSAFVARYPDRIINIHHSFLPAFSGANPYRQAFARGVKIIGATVHFVTDVLDDGPIIAQGVVPIDHSYRPEEMAQAGREVEKAVLAKGVKLVCENRVFVSGNRTIVFG